MTLTNDNVVNKVIILDICLLKRTKMIFFVNLNYFIIVSI